MILIGDHHLYCSNGYSVVDMADDVDKSQERIDRFLESGIHLATKRANNIPKGEPGICKFCGWDSPRLVNGVCAPCRDKGFLP